MKRPIWFNSWTILAILTMPIAAFFILVIEEIDNILILIYHVSSLAAILIAQRLWYRFQFQICSKCFIQREFHNKTKYNRVDYPQLEPLVCDKFKKGRFS